MVKSIHETSPKPNAWTGTSTSSCRSCAGRRPARILFAFLLGVAYTRPFRHSDDFIHVLYAVTLLLCTVATALLIGPVALHRMLFRQG